MSNPYEAPNVVDQAAAKSVPSRTFGEIALCFSAIVVLLAVIVFIVASRAKFGGMFTDFELKLPFITQFVLSVSYPALVGGLLVFTVAKEIIPSWRRGKMTWNIAMLFVAVVLLLIYLAGIFLPLSKLIEGLSR
jgi:hypothetical protein